MNWTRRTLAALVLTAGAVPVALVAQAPPLPPVPATLERLAEVPLALQDDGQPERERERWGRPVLRIGQGYTLLPGHAAREAVVILGDAVIDGQVDRDVVVILGQARLSGTALVGGSLVVVGGSAVASSGATVREDVVIVGGGLTAPPEFSPGGQHIVVGPAALGGGLEGILPWLTRGLLWGRLIVPGLPWMWSVVGVVFLVYLALNLVFHAPVQACAETLAGKPLTAFAVGLLVLVLIGPVSLLLMLSVVGIAVVPFVLCAIFIAGVIGKAGVARWVGMSIVPQDSLDARLPSLRSFVLGSALIYLAYMIPLLGLVTWTMAGVFGLGAATMAFMSAYRRENPRPIRPARPPRPVAPMPEQPDSAGPGALAAEASATSASVVETPVTRSDAGLFPHASFLERLAAFVLDVLLVAMASQVLAPPGRDSRVFLLLLAYHIGFWTWKATTVGGIICQLRVVRVDGAPLRFVDALVRGLSSVFSLVVGGLGCLWILKDPERQAWHDKIAGTYVVKVPRTHPL